MNVKLANELLRCGYAKATACSKLVDKVGGRFTGSEIGYSNENEELGLGKRTKYIIFYFQAYGTNWSYRLYLKCKDWELAQETY